MNPLFDAVTNYRHGDLKIPYQVLSELFNVANILRCAEASYIGAIRLSRYE